MPLSYPIISQSCYLPRYRESFSRCQPLNIKSRWFRKKRQAFYRSSLSWWLCRSLPDSSLLTKSPAGSLIFSHCSVFRAPSHCWVQFLPNNSHSTDNSHKATWSGRVWQDCRDKSAEVSQQQLTSSGSKVQAQPRHAGTSGQSPHGNVVSRRVGGASHS